MVDNMIRLFESTATSFATNGLGALPDASKCEVVEERNGSFELEMEYHVSGRRYGDLALRRLIVAPPNPFAEPQPFRIYDISKPINGLVTVKAEHISYDMTGYPVSPFTATDVTSALSSLQNNAIVTHPFEFSADISASGDMEVLKPASMRSLLGGSDGSILDIYGGELEFDVYKVILHSERGADRGVTIRYGKNMTDLTQEESCSDVYTDVYPFWYSDEWGLVELPEKTIAVSGTHDYTRIYPLDLSSDWENTNEWEDEYPSEDELRELAENYISENDIGTPTVSLTVSFEKLSQSGEYATLALLETVHLCDTVRVEFPELGVSATSKCIKTTYDVLTGKYTSIELGESQSNLADGIASQNSNIDEQISDLPTKSFMTKAVERATQLISGGLGGYVVIRSSSGGDHPDEILIMDTDDITTATKVWRWNKGGLGYSDKGYNGPYTTAITQDGEIVADFVKTGHLTASIIQGGTLTVGGIDNTDGTVEVRDANNELLVKLSVNGLEFFNTGGKVIASIVEGKVDADYISGLELTVGKEIQMGEDAKISWSNIEGTEDVASKSDIPSDEYITTISQNAITSEHIRGLELTVGNEIQMGPTATISWSNVEDTEDVASKSDIPTDINQLSDASGQKWSTTVGNTWIKTADVYAQNLTVSSANIDGTLTASQIDATNLQVAAANVTGTLSASQIDATNLKVLSANINGMLTASQIDATNLQVATVVSENENDITRIQAGKMETSQLHLLDEGNYYPGIIKWDSTKTEIKNAIYFTDYNVTFPMPIYITNNGNFDWILTSELVYEKAGMVCDGRIYSYAICPQLDADYDIDLATGESTKTDGYPCGRPDYKWTTVYARSGTVNTSDRNKKHDINDISEIYEKLFFLIRPVTYMFNNGERTHIGAISQELEEAMDSLGLTDMDVAGFCRDVKMKTVKDEESGEVSEVPDLDEDGNVQYNYGMRYSEFIMLNTHMIQKAFAKIEEQQAEIDDLKAKVDYLLNYIGERG